VFEVKKSRPRTGFSREGEWDCLEKGGIEGCVGKQPPALTHPQRLTLLARRGVAGVVCVVGVVCVLGHLLFPFLQHPSAVGRK